MQKGGYQIIDLLDVPLTTEDVYYIEGIYAKIANTRKPILLSGLNFDGKDLRDGFVDVLEVAFDTELSYQLYYNREFLITIDPGDILSIRRLINNMEVE